MAWTWLKKLLGEKLTRQIRPWGHGLKSYLTACLLGFPSKKLTVIGITGTKGKTSTSIYLGRLLNLAGLPAGYISTASICLRPYTRDLAELEQSLSLEKNSEQKNDADFLWQRIKLNNHFAQVYSKYETLNQLKMTTLDGVQLQKALKTMYENGCQYAVLEMSSQGLEQKRHWGIAGFDLAVFLNIYPEHIEAHGSWENYRKAKAILFANLKKEGVFIANGNSDMLENTEYMWSFVKGQKTTKKVLLVKGKNWQVLDTESFGKQLQVFEEKGNSYILDTYCLADFELDNLFFAYSVLKQLQPNFALSKEDLVKKFNFNLPGRMQWAVIDNQIV